MAPAAQTRTVGGRACPSVVERFVEYLRHHTPGTLHKLWTLELRVAPEVEAVAGQPVEPTGVRKMSGSMKMCVADGTASRMQSSTSLMVSVMS